MRIRRFLACVVTALVALAATARTGRADYWVIPLPNSINGIKGADFKLTDQCLVNYPTGNRDM